ncbi:hypothetical protein LRP88_12674 [Fusarium phalaenopsidis]
MPSSDGSQSGAEVASDGHTLDMLSILPMELRHIIYSQLAGDGSLIKVSSHESILPSPNSYHYAHHQGVQMVQEHIALLLFFKGEALRPDNVPIERLHLIPQLYSGIAALSQTSRQHREEIKEYLSTKGNIVMFSTANEFASLRASHMATFALSVVREVTFVVMVTVGNRGHPASEAHWSHDCMCHYGVEEEDYTSGVVDPEPVGIQARLPLPDNELVHLFDFSGEESEIEPRYLAEAGSTWDGEECIREIQAHGANPMIISVLYSEAGRRGPPGRRVVAYPKHTKPQQFRIKVCVKEEDGYVATGPQACLKQISEIAGVTAIEERTAIIPGTPQRYGPALITKSNAAGRT